ncbi:uncharacterized protein ACA1_255420 [Acanthamoeba castellanii str. Neff]|uniref:Uncharacterized protein n=1 Tax=Acanthamoeba castellanii (strain ATCC 30010 / Neff) TaxID=1257118 RepID=L8HCF4_ACACF|nr:uncharacterized protein ACA1_255420 [Acanthamoeba castellanii str. Neff]ELR22433.1 hypothetical protein ACA1_255420 [Acanthamoeba castellanii str. Neff]
MVQVRPLYGLVAVVAATLLLLFFAGPSAVPRNWDSAPDALLSTTIDIDIDPPAPTPPTPTDHVSPSTKEHTEPPSRSIDEEKDEEVEKDASGDEVPKTTESPPTATTRKDEKDEEIDHIAKTPQPATKGKEEMEEEDEEEKKEEKKVSDYTLVVYVYWERDAVYAENLRFFLRAGVGSAEESQRDRVEYLLIVQGRTLSVDVPRHVKVWKRDNTCFDFGAVGAALRSKALRLPTFRRYVILNSSVKGPFLPAYWPSNVHWSTIFTSRINDRVKQVGTSIVCLPKTDLGGWGPRIEGFCWATDHVGIELGIKRGVFDCFANKEDVIVKGEYGMSRAVLDANYTLDTVQLKYQGVNWTDTANWGCNANVHPTRADAYDGISMHPLETVFHKRSWTDVRTDVLPEYMNRYAQWKYDALDRRAGKSRPPS